MMVEYKIVSDQLISNKRIIVFRLYEYDERPIQITEENVDLFPDVQIGDVYMAPSRTILVPSVQLEFIGKNDEQIKADLISFASRFGEVVNE